MSDFTPSLGQSFSVGDNSPSSNTSNPVSASLATPASPPPISPSSPTVQPRSSSTGVFKPTLGTAFDPTQATLTDQTQPSQGQPKGIFSSLAALPGNFVNNAKQAGQDWMANIQKRGATAGEDIKQGLSEASPVKQAGYGFAAGGEALGGILDTVGAALKASGVADLIALEIKNMKDVANSVTGGGVDKISQGANSLWDQLQQKHPLTAKVLESLGNAAQVATLGGGAEPVAEATPEIATRTGEVVGNAATKVGEVAGQAKNAVTEATAGVGSSIEGKATQMAKDAWAKPSTLPNTTYSKAGEIFKNAASAGHDIGQTLVDNKINLSNNIENRIYNTADTAEKIRQDAAKTSNELLRPSLEKASPNVERTSAADVVRSAKENIQGNRALTAETKLKLIDQLDQTQVALEKQYPHGLSLTDLHDEKIVRGVNSKFSPVGDIATNLEAQKNNALRDSLKTLVEDKTPEGIPVKEFNAELQKQFQAADYLDALDGKKVPVSLTGKIASTAAKVVGAGVGETLGGGIFGGVGGYHIGGMVEKMLSSIPGKLRDSLLTNLEATNPEAFAKVKNYIETEHPIPLGPAKAPILPPDTSGIVAQPEFDTAIKDAEYQLQKLKDAKAQADLKKIIEERKPTSPELKFRPSKGRI